MGARGLLAELVSAGFSVEAADDKLLIRPASKLTDDLRAALRQAKPELLQLLALQAALTAAMHRACNARGDDAANRAALLAECTELSSEAQADMLAHFTIIATQHETINRGTPGWKVESDALRFS